MRDTEAQLVNSRSTPSGATHKTTLSTGGFTLTGIFSTRSIMKLLIVAAVVVGGLFWMGGSEDVHAGGKGNDKGAKVTTIVSDEVCVPDESAEFQFCFTTQGRVHEVETPSGNVVKTERIVVDLKILSLGKVVRENTQVIKTNQLKKDDQEFTLRSHSEFKMGTEECQLDVVVANGEIRFNRLVCEPV